LDLRDLQVKYLSFDGGASRITLTLPARVENMVADIEAGAASIDLNVPQGVGLRLRLKSIGSANIDQTRFARVRAISINPWITIPSNIAPKSPSKAARLLSRSIRSNDEP